MTPEEIYRRLYLIRRVEEEVARVYPTDRIQSPIHLSIGQELGSVAVCAALLPQDKVFGSYRSHALYLAKGGNLNAFVAELYGKVTGCARGKGGSMHVVEPAAGLLGTSAIVGSLIPVAVGYALGQKLAGNKVVTACFFGDGAAEEGCFFESLNFAALHRLPILFVCENNGYAIHTPIRERQSTDIVTRASAFGIGAAAASNYHDILSTAAGLASWVRDDGGPKLLEIKSPRLKEHVGTGEDWHLGGGYRKLDPTWKDPVDVAAGFLPTELVSRLRQEVDAEVAEAFRFAEESAAPGADELMKDLYG